MSNQPEWPPEQILRSIVEQMLVQAMTCNCCQNILMEQAAWAAEQHYSSDQVQPPLNCLIKQPSDGSVSQ